MVFLLMELTAFFLYLCVLVISPLLFGAVHVYAYSLAFLLILIASLLVTMNNIRRDLRTGSLDFQYLLTPVNFIFLAYVFYLGLQMVPLPGPIISQLSLHSSFLQGAARDGTSFQTLAPQVYPVRMSLVRWIGYGLFFIGFAQTLNSRKRIGLAVACILATATFDSVYGIFQSYSGANRIWWFAKLQQGPVVNGTFINRNDFACYMAMAVLLATAYAAALSLRGWKGKGPVRSSFKERWLRLINGEQSMSKQMLVVFFAAVAGLGLMLSASRGGIFSVTGGLLLLGFLFVLRQNHRRQGLYVLLVFAMIIAYSLQVGVDHALERFVYFDVSRETRGVLVDNTMNMFRDFKNTGVGLGNFQHAFPGYQSPQFGKTAYLYAHNDYAQLLAEGGVAGFIVFALGLLYFLFSYCRSWLARQDPYAVALGAAPLAVLCSIAIHSYADFNLHLPANFLTMTGIFSVGFSAMQIKKRRAGEKTMHQFNRKPLKGQGGVALFFILFLIFWAGTWTVRHFTAEAYCSTVRNSTMNRDDNPPVDDILSAIQWDQDNAAYWFKLARVRMKERDQVLGSPDASAQEKRDAVQAAINALEQAVNRNPFMAQYAMLLAWEYTYLWQEPDYREKWLPAADNMMDRAAALAGEKTPYLHFLIAKYWVSRSQTLAPDAAAWPQSLTKAGRHFQKALELESGTSRNVLQKKMQELVWSYYPSAAIIKQLGIE